MRWCNLCTFMLAPRGVCIIEQPVASLVQLQESCARLKVATARLLREFDTALARLGAYGADTTKPLCLFTGGSRLSHLYRKLHMPRPRRIMTITVPGCGMQKSRQSNKTWPMACGFCIWCTHIITRSVSPHFAILPATPTFRSSLFLHELSGCYWD